MKEKLYNHIELINENDALISYQKADKEEIIKILKESHFEIVTEKDDEKSLTARFTGKGDIQENKAHDALSNIDAMIHRSVIRIERFRENFGERKRKRK